MTDSTPHFKSQLAKLLATENISFRHDPGARTAYFDIKNRELVLPVWQNISEDLYDMLVVHEVGHALDTPPDAWMKAIDDIATKVHGENVTRRAQSAIKGFMNVIEDARIDKRQKRRYPGSKRNYVAGYKELIDRDFFGTASRNINSMSFIDRANMYYKGGAMLGIQFNAEERPFIKAMDETETFEDVIALTEKIYAWAKQKGEENAQKLDPSDFEEGEGEGEYESFDIDEDMDDLEDADTEVDADDEGDDSEEMSDGRGKSKSDLDDKDSDEDDQGGRGNDAGSGKETQDYVPESETERKWEENVNSILSNSDVNYVYIDIPEPIMESIVDDYKTVQKEQTSAYMTQVGSGWREANLKALQTFKAQENATISFMVKEFEQRKAAELYAKISIAKTGVINTNKLPNYKFSDDIFRRTTVVPQGKNHGFVMFLDWSGSMNFAMDQTVKQLITLTMFCKRVQIPFEVYSFRDWRSDEYDNKYLVRQPGAPSWAKGNYHQFKYNSANYMEVGSPFKLRNILSSRMNAAELNKAYELLMGHRATTMFEPMNGTPLNGAIIAAEKVVNDFRKRNKLEIVNTIFLTDGDSNGVAGFQIDRSQYPHRRKGDLIILRDNVSKKEYKIGDGKWGNHLAITNSLLSILRDRTQSNMVGFFLTTDTFTYNWHRYFSNEKGAVLEKTKAFWKDNKFIPVKSEGYDEYYVINGRDMSLTNGTLKVDSSMTKGKIAKEFMKFSGSKTINRILLRQFIDRVAKQKVRAG